MRGSELLDIDTLYDLEVELLRYPGLELEAVLQGSMIEYEEDGEVGARFEPFGYESLLFRFRGPAFGEKGRPASLVPVSAEAVHEEFVREYVIHNAVEALESLVKGNGGAAA